MLYPNSYYQLLVKVGTYCEMILWESKAFHFEVTSRHIIENLLKLTQPFEPKKCLIILLTNDQQKISIVFLLKTIIN